MSIRVRAVVRANLHPASPMLILVVALGLLGLIGVAVVAYATRIEPWAFSDGAGYIMLARNMLAGRGLGFMRASGEFQHLSWHPPLYPLSLVAIGLTGVELLTAARWLDAALFVVAIVSVGSVIYYVSRLVWLSVAAAAVTLATTSLVVIYAGTLSEPLYFAASLGILMLLLIYFGSSQRWMLIAAAALAGLTVVTRYVGIAFVAAGLPAILLFAHGQRQKRFLDAAAFVAIAALPTILWLGWLSAQGGSNAPRQWSWNLSDLWARTEPVRGGIVAEFWNWVPFANAVDAVPYRYQLGILATIGVVLSVLTFLMVRTLRRKNSLKLRRVSAWQLLSINALFITIYLAVLTGVFLFSQPPPSAADIGQRILTPVYLATLLSAFALVSLVRQTWPKNSWMMVAPLILTALLLAWFIPQSWRQIQRLHDTSAGFTSQTWMNSETMENARSLPDEVSIITNESTAMMFLLDRPSYDVPELLRGEAQSEFLRFGDGKAGEERIFREDGAALILFDSVYWQLRGVYDEQAGTRLASMIDGLVQYADLSDGAIYFYPQP